MAWISDIALQAFLQDTRLSGSATYKPEDPRQPSLVRTNYGVEQVHVCSPVRWSTQDRIHLGPVTVASLTESGWRAVPGGVQYALECRPQWRVHLIRALIARGVPHRFLENYQGVEFSAAEGRLVLQHADREDTD